MLNGVILAVLLLGIAWTIRQVLALTREVEWIEAFRNPVAGAPTQPGAEAARADGVHARRRAESERLSLSAIAMRVVLDGIVLAAR